MPKNRRTEGYPTANKGSLRDPSLSLPRTALKKGTTSLRSVGNEQSTSKKRIVIKCLEIFFNVRAIVEIIPPIHRPSKKKFINHRAKRGGSLFQGGSGERERGREATPPLWGRSPHQGREATLCWRWGTPPFVGFLAKTCPKR